MSGRSERGDLRALAAGTLLTSFAGVDVPPWLLARVESGAGGVCLYGSNRGADFAGVSSTLKAAAGDVLVACDEEGGDVTRLEALTGSSVPGNAALGAVDDVELTRDAAAALGGALRLAGIDLDLAPCADVNSDPENPVIGVRSFSDAAATAARHTAAFVAGLHDSGVAACVKHFPGHGAVAVDSHVDLPVIDVAVDVLRQRELLPFVAAIGAGVDAVMPGHLLVPALDRRPATISTAIISGLLRDELGFAGAVVTDALDMGGIGGRAKIPDTVVQAILAGADLCCLGPDNTGSLFDACVEALIAAVTTGTLAAERLAEAASRVGGLHRAPGDATPLDLQRVGAEAAARAVCVTGDLPPSMAGAYVIELDRPVSIAAGAVPWGIGDMLHDLDPSVVVARVVPSAVATAPSLVFAAGEAPLVVVTRDANRLPELWSALQQVVAARPDAVLVDMGWPVTPPASHRGPMITTHGGSRASAAAVVAVLVPASPDHPQLSPERTTHG